MNNIDRTKDSILDAFFIISIRKDKFVYASKVFEELWGTPPKDSQWALRFILETIYPEDRPKLCNLLSGICTEGIEQCRILRQDGTVRWIRLRIINVSANVDIYQIGFLEDITEQLADTLALSHRLKIEERLGKIAANLIQTPTEEIAESIAHVLKEIGEWIQADRCYLFYIDNNAHCMSNTHEWCAEGISTQRDFLQNLPLQMFPWVIQKLQSNTVINVPNVQNMTDEAAAERTILQMQDILSVLLVPVIADETLIGFVGFDGVVDHRIWAEADIVVLQLVADLIGSALQRLEHDVSMAAYEIRLSMALAASSSGLIDYDVTSNLAYLSPEFYATLGFTDIRQSRQVPLEMLWSWIHPDDLPRVQQAAKDIVNNKTRFHQCFRIRNVCDQYCWYCLRAENLIHPLTEKHRVIGVLSDMTMNTQTLTKRESEVLDLLAEDLTVKEIACRLAISHHTVDNHLRKIYAKLGTQTKLQSILRANSMGLLHFS